MTQNIVVRVGDLLESKAQTLVNTVNCHGVMGKGIALAFKDRFPAMFKDYQRRCEAHQVRLGEPYFFDSGWLEAHVINFPTKDHWRSRARIGDIVAGLEFLKLHYREWGVTSMAVPPLGCGEGGLEWRVVGPTLYRHLSELEIPVELYAPRGTRSQQLEEAFLKGEAAPSSDTASRRLGLADILLAATIAAASEVRPVSPGVLLLAAFFLRAAGAPIGLNFTLARSGVVSPGAVRMRTRLVNNGVLSELRAAGGVTIAPGTSFADAKRQFSGGLIPWASQVHDVADFVSAHPAYRLKLTAVTQLVASLRESAGIADADLAARVTAFPGARTGTSGDVIAAIADLRERGWLLGVAATDETAVCLGQT